MIRYEIEMLYPVRAKRGESRGPGGCLRKNIIGNEDTLQHAKEYCEKLLAVSDYAKHVETRFYNLEEVRKDILTAKPIEIIKGE